MKIASILIPVYNQEELIKKAINSIPDRKDIEIIVVNDASTDNTLNSVLSFKRPITVINLSTRKSIGYCRNLCLKRATGKFAIWIDSDDYVDTKQFNKFLDWLRKNQWPDLVHVDLINNRGHRHNGPDTCATVSKVTKLSTIRRLGLYYKDITVGEDKVFWEELKEKHVMTTHYMDLYYYYNYPRENSTSWLAERKIIREEWRDYV